MASRLKKFYNVVCRRGSSDKDVLGYDDARRAFLDAVFYAGLSWVHHVDFGQYQKARKNDMPRWVTFDRFDMANPLGVLMSILFWRSVLFCEQVLPDWWCEGDFDPDGDEG